MYKDCNNRIVRVNDALAKFIGMPAEKLAGMPLESLLPVTAAEIYAQDLEVLATGVPRRGIIAQYRNAAGQGRWFHIDKVPYRDELGRVEGVLVLALDITERLESEERLRRISDDLAHSNAELDRFAHIVSHDLREPLRMVSSFVTLLSRK